jgi:hypothetical protein
MKSKGIYQKEEGALLKKNDKKTAKSGAPKACALNILKRLQKSSSMMSKGRIRFKKLNEPK